MRFYRFRLLLTLFAALWLPFQAVAAKSMAFCWHGQMHGAVTMQVAADDADTAMADCPMHRGAHDPAPASDGGDHGQGCDQCGFCHLASAGVMSGPERATAVVPADQDFLVVATRTPASNIPEPPQRPPKRAA